jgi:hypothetical protein
MKRVRSLLAAAVLLVLAGTHVAVGQEPSLPLIAPQSSEQLEGESRADQLYRGSFTEISLHYEHYRQQAFRYQWIDRIARLLILIASTTAALILAMTESKRARRVAIVLSMVVATTQAADQQFNLSKMREVSWRTAADLNRLLSELREEWVFTDAAGGDPDEALRMVRQYRERFNAAVEREMNVSLAPIQRTP